MPFEVLSNEALKQAASNQKGFEILGYESPVEKEPNPLDNISFDITGGLKKKAAGVLGAPGDAISKISHGLSTVTGGLIPETSLGLPTTQGVGQFLGVDMPQDASGLPTGVRLGGQMLARAGETALGAPGGILSILPDIGHYIKPDIIPSYEQAQEKFPLPLTPEQFHKGTQYFTGNKLEPQNELEANAGEFVSDLTGFMLPGGFALKTAAKLAGVGQLIKLGVEKIGNPTLGTLGKVGYHLIASMPNGIKELTEIKKENYVQAIENLPQEAKQDATQLKVLIKDMFARFNKSKIVTETNEFLKSALEPVKDRFKHVFKRNINIEDAIADKQRLNALLQEKTTPEEAKNTIRKVVNTYNNVIEDYGKTRPAFYEPWQKAEDINGGISAAEKVNEFLSQNMFTKFLTSQVAQVIVLGHAYRQHGIGGLIKAGASELGAISGLKKGTAGYLLLKNSKEARTYYRNALKAAAVKNVATTTKNLRNLNEVAEDFNYSQLD